MLDSQSPDNVLLPPSHSPSHYATLPHTIILARKNSPSNSTASTTPSQKRQKQPTPITSPALTTKETLASSTPALAPKSELLTSPNSRKRRASQSPNVITAPPGPATTAPETQPNVSIPALLADDNGKKRGRTNTPWTPQEEQLLKQMRDNGLSWSEIAKVSLVRSTERLYWS